jgi:hypothetical protein
MGTTGSVLRASRCALALAGKRLTSRQTTGDPLVVSGRNAIPETEGGRCKAPVHSSSSLYYQTLLPRPSPMQSCVIDSSSNAAGHPRSNARSHMHLSTVSIHPYIRAHTAYVRILQGTPEPATTTYVNLISSVPIAGGGLRRRVLLTVLIVSVQNNPNHPAHLGRRCVFHHPPPPPPDTFGRSH